VVPKASLVIGVEMLPCPSSPSCLLHAAYEVKQPWEILLHLELQPSVIHAVWQILVIRLHLLSQPSSCFLEIPMFPWGTHLHLYLKLLPMCFLETLRRPLEIHLHLGLRPEEINL
jgi:hypothetical protein